MTDLEYLASIGITDPEDIEATLDATGIEIRIMYDNADEHEGYYNTIDEAIEALQDLKRAYPQLNY